MVSRDLLEILRCPQSHQRLTPAPPELLAQVNAAIAAGHVRNRAGEAVTAPLEAALLREDRQWLYAIVEGIPIMLIDEAIPLEPITRSE